MEAREKLYALRADVQAWILSSIVQFHSAYGLAYREGEVLEVPDKMAWDEHSEPMNVLHYKKLEDNSDGVATLVTATVPVDTLYAADSTILPFEQYKDASVICFENFARISAEYIQNLLNSPYMVETIKSASTGTTVGTITMVKANEYLIPLPPLAEQQRIVEAIESVFKKLTI